MNKFINEHKIGLIRNIGLCLALIFMFSFLFSALPVGATPSNDNVYRLSNSREHFYTTSTAERDNASAFGGYRYEGIGWARSSNPTVYRLNNGVDHFYTTSVTEKASAIVFSGYKSEGVGWYDSYPNGPSVYRLNNGVDHFYTTNPVEKTSAAASGYNYEGIAWGNDITQLTITDPTVTSTKVYDGNTIVADCTPGELSGVVGDDNVYVTGCEATYATATVGSKKTVNVVYALDGTDAAKYAAPADGTATADITAVAITAIAPITGTTMVNSVLTAGALTPSDATATYQWQRSDAVDGEYSNISGATNSTYTVTVGDLGKYIQVVATGSVNYSGTATSTVLHIASEYTLTYTANSNGSIFGVSTQTVDYCNASTAVTAIADAYYHFLSWSDSFASATRPVNSCVTSDATASASFGIDAYTLAYNAGANGSITGTALQTVNHGADGSAVTPTPAAGYGFVNWSDESTSNPRTDINVVANKSVTANFADITAPVGGLLTLMTTNHPSPGITVANPTDGRYTITPALTGTDNFSSISVVVTDNATLNTSNVPVYIDGEGAGAINGHMAYSGSGGVWNYVPGTPVVFAEGQHNLVATFEDNAGNHTTLTVRFMTDKTAPVGGSLTLNTVNHPTGITVADPTDGIYTITPALTGDDVFTSIAVAVTDDDLNTSSVPVYFDGSEPENINGTMAYSGGVWNYVPGTPVVFTEGQHDLVATFRDNAGNTTTLTVRFTTDRTAPALVSVTAILGGESQTKVIADQPLTATVNQTVGGLTATLNETSTLVSGDTGSITISGGLIPAGTPYGTFVVSGTTVTITPNTGNDALGLAGTFTFTVAADTIKDAAGNKNAETNFTMLVSKDTTVIDSAVTATNVTLGQTLSNSTLGGTFKNSLGDAVPGVIVWDSPTDVVSDTRTHAWTFTPTDSANYSVATGMINVTARVSITSEAGTNGAISPDGVTTVNYGAASQTYTITPNENYHIESLTVDGSPVTIDTNYEFTDIITTHSISATFAIDTHSLTYSAGTGGSISGTSPQTINYGADGSAVTAVANAGFHFVNWTPGDSTVATRTDTTITADHTYTANFEADHTIDISAITGVTAPVAGGTPVTAITNATQYTGSVTWAETETGTPVGAKFSGTTGYTAFITITAASEYTLTGVGINFFKVAGASPTTNLANSGAVAATFPATGKETPVVDSAVTSTPVTLGALLSTSTLGGTFKNSNNVTVAGTLTWDVPGTVINNTSARPWTFTPDNTTDYNIVEGTVSVVARVTIDSSVTGENGTVSPTPSATVNYGTGQTFTMSPSTGYHVEEILVDGDAVTVGNSYEFTNITATHTISVSFAIDTHTLTYTAGSNGSITGTTPQTIDYAGNGTEVTAVPAANYHFVKWSDDVATAARTDTNVTGDIAVTATFAIDTHTLTYTAGSNGSITGTTPQTIDYAGNGTEVTAVANAGYSFVMWSDTESSTNPRTDTNVTTNITATASFTANENTVVFNGNGDTVGATADQKMHTADVANLTANGYTMTGYTFAGWNTLANGSGTAYADTASYTMGTDASVTLYAQWISDADIAAVAGAKSAISGGTYTNLVVTDSADQAIKTAAVQAKVNLYKGTTTATVTWADPNYNVAISQGGASDSYTITTATFLQTINIADIDGVTPPVAGATPVTTITESSQYTGSVTWTPNDVKFASITEYTARIALTAKAGYTFIGVSASYFTVDGSSNTFNSANSGVVNAVFPTTDQLAEGSAVANDGTKVITYVLATGTFDHTAGEVVGNWVLDGTSHGGIEPIVSVVLSGDHETATITVTSDIVAVGNYTIAPAQAAFSAGFTAPAAVTVYIPA